MRWTEPWGCPLTLLGLETNLNRLPRGGSPYCLIRVFHQFRSSAHAIAAPTKNIVDTTNRRCRSSAGNLIATVYSETETHPRRRKTRAAFTASTSIRE